MAGTFLFELVSPERLLVSQQTPSVVLPGSEGYFTVMADHSPMIVSIAPGVVKLTTDEGAKRFVVYGGFADITPTSCSLLAESAVSVDEFFRDNLKHRIEAAREAMNGAPNDEARNKLEDFFHQLTTVEGVLTEA